MIAESHFFQKPIKWHLNYYTIAEREAEFGAKRIILTHMSEEILAYTDEVPEEAAYDGLVVNL